MQRIIVLLFCMITGSGLFAQTLHFNQSFGLGASSGNVTGTAYFADGAITVRSNYTLRVKTFGIVYAPRVDLFDTKDFSISVAMPLLVGFSTTNRYRSVDARSNGTDTTVEGLRGTHFAFEVPVIADFNFGLHSAADESKRNLGFFVGAGYMYNYTKVKTTAGKVPYDQWEPVLRAGIRMGSEWEKRWCIVFNIRGKLESGASKTYGLQLLKEL